MSRLPTSTVDDRTLRRNIGISAVLHTLGLLFLFFGLPSLVKPLPKPYMPIPFEIVTVADLTNTRTPDQPQEMPKPPAPPPKPEVKAAPQPPQPPAPPQQAQPQPPQPEPPKPAESAQVEAPMPKPESKPKPPEVAKPKPDMLASVLKNVEKLKPAVPVKTPDAKAQTKQPAQAQANSAAPSLSERLTISEEDALRRQIEQCWNPPIGARNAKDLRVDVSITVNPDRTVQSVEVIDKVRMASDPYFRSAGEAAIRALYNPRCSPLELPDGKFDQWKVISFTFDPGDML